MGGVGHYVITIHLYLSSQYDKMRGMRKVGGVQRVGPLLQLFLIINAALPPFLFHSLSLQNISILHNSNPGPPY